MIETTSGTARTRRKAITAAAAIESPQRAVFGSQIVLDLYDCETDRIDDLAWVKETLINAAREAGATIVETVFHKFSPWGISGVVVIAESHLAIHIWPENRYAAIDVFTCGQNVRMDVASAFLKREFRAGRAVQRSFARGDRVSRKAPAVTNLQHDCKEGRVECR
jgi:S-adenosylmethionine decarboxylase proenzyme